MGTRTPRSFRRKANSLQSDAGVGYLSPQRLAPNQRMTVSVHLWSYFRDLAGTSRMRVEIADGGTVDAVLDAVYAAHPKLEALRQSTLIAVGVEYQGRSHVVRPGEEVSLFPPVQGG